MGRYHDTGDSYYSLKEALSIASRHAHRQADITIVTPEDDNLNTIITASDLVCVSCGPHEDLTLYKPLAQLSRDNNISYLGIA